MTQWRVLSDHVIEVKSTIGEHEEKIKELKKIIQSKLFIADNAEISETVSIPGVGSASKKKTISIRVHDWKSFQAYLARNNMEAVMLSFEEYEFLRNLEDVFDQFEIKSMLDKRFKNYTLEKNVSWDKVKEDI